MYRHFQYLLLYVLLILPFQISAQIRTEDKARVIVTTDLGGSDPDDIQSMIHLLLCSDMVDIEGLVSSQTWIDLPDNSSLIRTYVDEYAKVFANLKVHSAGFPDPEYLKSVTVFGQRGCHMDGVGQGKDSEGSDLIIRAVDNKSDARPVWVLAWGGTNSIAQALWKVAETRTEKEVAEFVSKIRVYDILGQDDAGAWIAKTFQDLIYIRNTEVYGWAPSDDWTDANIQSVVPLGTAYPDRIWATEGDSPSFLYLLANGLNVPEHPEYGGWGGRFDLVEQKGIRGMSFISRSGKDESKYDPYYMTASAKDGVGAINKWRQAIWNNFAARMSWTAAGIYEEANHHPVAMIGRDRTLECLTKSVRPGTVLKVDASSTYDPDGDPMTFRWEIYKEPGTYKGRIQLQGADLPECSVMIPDEAAGSVIHLVLEVTDSGTPALTSYRRVVINVKGRPEKNVMGLKPRIVVLTDIAPGDIEPDDMESMIRLMSHADLFEIEGLITSGGWNSSGRPYPVGWKDSLSTTIIAYEKDLPNLMKRSCQKGFMSLKKEQDKQSVGYWPSAAYMRSRSMLGSLELGRHKIGEANRSAGSDHIISLADEDDERPIWILAWGGANTFAQAIWQVQQERTPEQVKAFLRKFRVYTITDQDVPWGERHSNYPFSSHYEMRRDLSDDLIFIWDESAWLSQNSIGSSKWREYAEHIQMHGYLGSIYPKNKWGVEGDTPSFLHVLPNGLHDPSVPEMAGWGGYFRWGKGMDDATYSYTNHTGTTKKVSEKYEHYFYPAVFNNFAARMDWAEYGRGNRNPVVEVNGVKGLDMIRMDATPGSTVVLDASSSYDPDDDSLSFRWWIMPESGTWDGPVDIKVGNSATAELMVPADASGHTVHVICEVRDAGQPALTSYRRVIINVSK
ncbi:MAG: DUF1593 domain-containing protein [Bacteroidales bacterium]|nr:DUF1593 domain-containing protein [Bacteroidales bacterium]